MKIATLNFSGNVGKSTVARHMLQPRLQGAALIAVETLNADEGAEATTRGKDFGRLQEELMLLDAAVVDIGASNVEDVMRLMQQYQGSHEEFDLYVVPVTPEAKQVRDTIATINALAAIGVKPERIRVVMNKVEAGEPVEDVFAPLFAFHEAERKFTLHREAVIYASELFQRLRAYDKSVDDLVADETDWRAKLREAANDDEKSEAVAMISMRRLAGSAKQNLDRVFALVTEGAR